jgi:hypothetical protein
MPNYKLIQKDYLLRAITESDRKLKNLYTMAYKKAKELEEK